MSFREEHDHELGPGARKPQALRGVERHGEHPRSAPPGTVKTLAKAKAEVRERNRRLPGKAKVYFMEDFILSMAAKVPASFENLAVGLWPEYDDFKACKQVGLPCHQRDKLEWADAPAA